METIKKTGYKKHAPEKRKYPKMRDWIARIRDNEIKKWALNHVPEDEMDNETDSLADGLKIHVRPTSEAIAYRRFEIISSPIELFDLAPNPARSVATVAK